LETLLKLNYPEYHTITFPDFGFRTVKFYRHLIPTNFLAGSKRTSVKGKGKIVSVINCAFKTYEGMKLWHHVFLTLTPEGLEQLAARLAMLTYLLTLWSRVRPEKLTSDFAASQEIPRIYGTRKSLTVPTSARHLFLS
jgi:hypothetical protein